LDNELQEEPIFPHPEISGRDYGFNHSKTYENEPEAKANGNIQKHRRHTSRRRKPLQEKPVKAEEAAKLPKNKAGNRSYVNSQ